MISAYKGYGGIHFVALDIFAMHSFYGMEECGLLDADCEKHCLLSTMCFYLESASSSLSVSMPGRGIHFALKVDCLLCN